MSQLKIRLCRFLVLCMLLVNIPLGMAGPAAAFGNGVLLNGGFESASGSGTLLFDGWKMDSTGSKATNGTPAGSTYARSGNNALKVTAGSGSQKSPAQQFVSVIPGQTYTISYYINVTSCTNAASSTGMTARFYDKANPDSFSITGSTQVGSDVTVGGVTGTTTAGYTLIQKSFTVPANANYVRFFMTSISSVSGSMVAYVDDVNLVKTAGSAPTEVTGVSLNKTATSILMAATETLTAAVAPTGAPQAVIWSSSNPSVATVDSNTGLVTGVNAGTAIITATSKTAVSASGPNAIYTATCNVTVLGGMPVPVYGLTVTPSFQSASVYIAGGREDLTRHLYYRIVGESVWKEALEPIYIPGKEVFSGSIVRLKEDTSYQVKSEVYYESTLVKSETATFRTWNSNPPIAQTISLSSIYSGGALTINGITGANNGWVKIENDTGLTIDAGYAANHAVTVTNSTYLILSGFIVKGGERNGIYLNITDQNVRIINADISGWGRDVVDTVHTPEQLAFIDKSDVGYGTPIDAQGNMVEGDAGIRIEDAKNIVVERSYVHEPRAYANPWGGVTSDGQTYSNSHPQGPEAMYLRSAGGLVVRYNDFSGSDEYHRFNDVISGYYNNQESGGFYKDADIYGNFFGYSNDDGVEFDGGQSNIRVFDNRFEMSYAGMSFAPNMVGPSYAFNNVLYNMNDYRRTGTGAVVKLGGNNSTVYKGQTWFFNNTIYAVPKAIVGSSTPKGWYGGTRNNLVVVMRELEKGTSYFYNIQDSTLLNPGSNFDYDALGRTTEEDGSGDIYANPGAEAHGLFKIGKMTNPAAGVFTPTASGIDAAKEASVIDKGTVVKNFAETFSGSAPDIGAFEVGGSSLFPKRPIFLKSDKYFVSIPEDTNTATFKITTETLNGTGNYTIRQNAEEDWYTVTPASGVFENNKTKTFTINVDRTKASFNRSAEYSTLFVRLANGYSVPITVKADNSVQTLEVGQNMQLASTKAFPNTANLNANWKSNGADVTIPTGTPAENVASVTLTGVSAGTATITANSVVNGVNQAEYRIRVPSRLSNLQVNGQTVAGFASDTYSYNVILPPGAAVPTVTAVTSDVGTAEPSAVTYSLPASIPGTAVVTTTAFDGTTSTSYTIHFSN